MSPGRRAVRQVEAGAGGPAVVLEAGLSNGAASWQRVMPLLAPHVRVAVRDGTIAGWTVAGPCRDDDRAEPWHGEIYACYVLPGSWRGGIGAGTGEPCSMLPAMTSVPAVTIRKMRGKYFPQQRRSAVPS